MATPVLSEKQRDVLMKSIMRSDGMNRTFSSRLSALQNASKKFGIRIKVSGKGTCDERYTLMTDHANDEIVRDYIRKQGVSITIVDFKITFSKKSCSDLS